MSVGLADTVLRELEGIFGPRNVSVDPATRRAYSSDYSWFSPLLKESVRGALADVVVWADSGEQLELLVKLADEWRVPVVARGAGTGNYAQSVPVRGGIVVDVTRMRRILGFEGGCVSVEPGVRLGELKAAAEKRGLTLRVYPSTYLVSTVAGFVEGGSGGVGSVEYGRLWDNNVLSATLVGPAAGRIEVRGEGLNGVIHSAGTTGMLTEVTLPLAQRRELCGLVAGFPTLHDAVAFSLRLAGSRGFAKRVVSLYEPAVARYFTGSVKDRVLQGGLEVFGGLEDSYVVIGVFEASAQEAVSSMVSGATGCAWLFGDEAERLSDYTFNHTTLWASKRDRVTWQHVFFDQSRIVEQSIMVKRRYGERIQFHYEFIRRGGEVMAGALPIVFYENPGELLEMLGYMASIGISVENIHSYYLEDRLGVDRLEAIRRLKRLVDPRDTLNPGKLRSI